MQKILMWICCGYVIVDASFVFQPYGAAWKLYHYFYVSQAVKPITNDRT